MMDIPTASSTTLSIIFHGRDDEYVENFVETLGFSVSFLSTAISSSAILDKIEIVLVDWGSTKSFLPAILKSVKTETSLKLNGHHVDFETAREMDGDSPYHVSKAVNFGLRMAEGEYVLVLSGNNILSQNALVQLLYLLENRDQLLPDSQEIYGLLPRRELPHPVAGSFSYEIINNYFKKLSLSNFPSNFKINSGGGASGLLFEKSLIEREKGFSEESGMYGWNDAEIFYRLTQFTSAIDLGNFGICGFKFWRQNDSVNINSRRLEFDGVRERYPNYLKPEYFNGSPSWGGSKLKKTIHYNYLSGDAESTIDKMETEYRPFETTKSFTYLEFGFKELITCYTRYRRSQVVGQSDNFYIKELIKIMSVLCEEEPYQIIITTDLAHKLLYFLLTVAPGLECAVLDYDSDKGDAETNFGRLAKRVSSFYHCRMIYIRGRAKADGFLKQNINKDDAELSGLLFSDPGINVPQEIRNDFKSRIVFKSEKVQISRLGNRIKTTDENKKSGFLRLSKFQKAQLFVLEVLSLFLCSYIDLSRRLKGIAKYFLYSIK